MDDDDALRTVVMIPTANPHVVLFRPMTPELAPVMGRFLPARYDKARHVYEVPASMADQLATFLRVHGIGVLNPPPEAERYAPSAETARVLAESRERAADPERQAAVNRRGMDLVRIAQIVAASTPPHTVDVDTGEVQAVAMCGECWRGHHDRCAGTHDHKCCCGQTVRLR